MVTTSLINAYNGTLSNGNLTFLHASNTSDGGASANNIIAGPAAGGSSGKVYFEVTINALSSGTDFSFGLAGSGSSYSVAIALNGHLLINGADVGASGVTLTSGHTYGIEADLSGGHFQINDITGSVTGTSFTIVTAAYSAYCLDNGTGPAGQFTFNFGATTFAATVPSGYIDYNSAANPPGTVDGTIYGSTGVNDYYHIYSQDDRTTGSGLGLYRQTSYTGGFTQYTSWDAAFDAEGAGSSGPYYTGSPTTSDYFEFQLTEAIAINGFRLWGGDGGTITHGTWTIEASNDGSSWTTLVSSYTWTATSTGISGSHQGFEIDFTNTQCYYLYRFRFLSGTFSGGRLCDRMHFRMLHSDLGGGPRSESPALVSVTAGPTGLSSRGANTVNDLADGLYHNGQPTAASVQVSLNTPSANDGITFNFYDKSVSIKRWALSTDGQFTPDYGTWQWWGSNDGTTFTASGSSFPIHFSTAVNAILFSTQVPAATDSYKFWQLRYLSGGGGSTLNGMYEITFDLTVTPASVWASVENPDTFAAIGYPGIPGVHGEWVSTGAPDVFTATGFQPVSGVLAATGTPDVFSGYIAVPNVGTWHSTEAPDRFAGTGLGRGENGVWLSTETADTFTGTGNVPISGIFGAVENPDHFRALGAGVTKTNRRRLMFVA